MGATISLSKSNGSAGVHFLFLDIDGVMIPFGEQSITPDCAENLRMIMDAVPDLGLVISSTWRFPPLERLLNIWRRAGLPPAWIFGCTPDLAGRPGQSPATLRGSEIRHWLGENSTGKAVFVIVDDQTDDISPCFPRSVIFETNPVTGLTRSDAVGIVRLLLSSARPRC